MSNTTSTTPSQPNHGIGYAGSTAVNIILSFFALICVPLFIYAFFTCLKCYPYAGEWRHQRSVDNSVGELRVKVVHMDLVYKIGAAGCKKEETGDETDECPVCLSMYVKGDEVRVLNSCKHQFHVSCISKWLSSHGSCPICRASVSVESGQPGSFPDSASYV